VFCSSPRGSRLARAFAEKDPHTNQMHTRRLRHLRDVHGAEFARADHADPRRLALRFALWSFAYRFMRPEHALAALPAEFLFPRKRTSYCMEQTIVGKALQGREVGGARCTPGRLKRRMWFDTAHKLNKTLTHSRERGWLWRRAPGRNETESSTRTTLWSHDTAALD